MEDFPQNQSVLQGNDLALTPYCIPNKSTRKST